MIFVYIFIGLVVALLVAAALFPKVYNVEKTSIIKKTVTEVMKRVANLNDYAAWNPWQKTEPDSSRIITGSPGTAGHRYAWQGKKIGMGSLTLNSIDDKHIHFELEFLKPWKSKARDNWLFEPWGDGETKVTWQNSGELPWPIARLMGPMISKNLNHQFETGLNNLKKLCEG
ncbi:MAG TPA: SRPBCC family protein [Chitinophagaceae bacterium]|nr:SRPBCC family protein [Chitinophagaceae bacterium]